ncbi:MAG TPA: SWIM zinc finger family protein [Blastocatellia bacterium]|nr:SWIM zinc finger family protein [Blastocatellia bacterium]
MPATLTTEQILALAPDAGSARNGQALAAARHWVTLGCDEQAAWGECQGSGKNPYQTQIDLSTTAFRCSCPSRKFPCKHGIGLYLLLASQPAAFTQPAAPAWVSEWLAARHTRAQQKAERLTQQTEAVTDETAQARRAEQRQKKVTAGLGELELWLRDLVRGGLIAAKSQPLTFWEQPARRMIDAQAPGVARLLREMSSTLSTGNGSEHRLLEQLARLWLLVEGFRRIAALPSETQADIRALIGWTQNQEELLAGSGVRDRWLVTGQRVTEEDRLRMQATWLRGITDKRHALLLHFAHASQPLDTSIVPGTVVDAELVFYPGAFPLRALIKARHSTIFNLETWPADATLAAAVEAYAAALARNPWLERFPFVLQSVVPLRDEAGRWLVRDEQNHALPIHPGFERGWELLALGGGRAIDLAGEWDGDSLLPLSVRVEGRFVRLS